MDKDDKKETDASAKAPDTKPRNVQTYTADMAKALEGNREGLIQKIIHEQEAKEAAKESLAPQSEKNKIFIGISAILLFFAFAIVVFFALKKDVGTVEVAQQFSPIIFTDNTTLEDITGLTKDKITSLVLNEIRSTSVKDGGIEAIYLTENKELIGLRRLMTLLKASFAPQPSVISDNFMIGVLNKDTKDVFFLMKTGSFQDTFPVMRAWEERMFYDLHGFFGMAVNPLTNYLLTKPFEDGIVANKNARILYDSQRKIVMMYIFADDSSIIISSTKAVAGEVMLRLSSGQIKK